VAAGVAGGVVGAAVQGGQLPLHVREGRLQLRHSRAALLLSRPRPLHCAPQPGTTTTHNSRLQHLTLYLIPRYYYKYLWSPEVAMTRVHHSVHLTVDTVFWIGTTVRSSVLCRANLQRSSVLMMYVVL